MKLLKLTGLVQDKKAPDGMRRMPVWVNPFHIVQLVKLEELNLTMISLAIPGENYAMRVEEPVEQIIKLINQPQEVE